MKRENNSSKHRRYVAFGAIQSHISFKRKSTAFEVLRIINPLYNEAESNGMPSPGHQWIAGTLASIIETRSSREDAEDQMIRRGKIPMTGFFTSA